MKTVQHYIDGKLGDVQFVDRNEGLHSKKAKPADITFPAQGLGQGSEDLARLQRDIANSINNDGKSRATQAKGVLHVNR